MDNWYRIVNENEVDSPALLVYPDRMVRNIEQAISMIGDVSRLRPHVKTHKTREILDLQLNAGIAKYKCATIAEAEMLGEGGAPDVLLAYPLLGPKVARFVALVKRFPRTRYAAIVDHFGAASALAETAVREHATVDVYIDLDLGMGRTGIQPGKAALDLYRRCRGVDGICLRGFHAYDGHVREIDLEKRKAICDQNFAPIAEMLRTIREAGEPKPKVIIGGSPSYPIYAAYPEVECSPGTFVLWDKGYSERLPEQAFLPAAALLCRVVSLPGDGLICVDLGYKAVASENPLDRRVHFLDAPDLKPVSQSEEHLVLEAPAGHQWQTGDVLYALPIHICPTVALYDSVHVVQDGWKNDSWKVIGRWR